MDGTVFILPRVTAGLTPPPHPSSQVVAAYVDGRLTADEREALEQHLADCDTCRREVVDVADLLTASRSRRSKRVVAAVGSVLLAASLAGVLLVSSRADHRTAASAPVLRGPPAEVEERSQVDIVVPPEGAVLAVEDLMFVWRSADARAFYRLTITDRNGDLMWKGETADTTLQLPGGSGLRESVAYFWYVDALLPDGASVTSGIHTFRTSP